MLTLKPEMTIIDDHRPVDWMIVGPNENYSDTLIAPDGTRYERDIAYAQSAGAAGLVWDWQLYRRADFSSAADLSASADR